MLNTKSKIDIPEFAPFQHLDAGITELDQTAQIRSEARLEQIFASARQHAPTVQLPRHRVSARTKAIRWAAIPVAAAGIIAASTMMPHNTVTVTPAFANWTAVPTAITDVPESALASYNEACLTFINDVLELRESDIYGTITLPTVPTIAEIRGDLTRLIYDFTQTQPENLSNAILPIGPDGNYDLGNTHFNCVIETSPLPATTDQIVFVVANNVFDGWSSWVPGLTRIAEPGPNWHNSGVGIITAGSPPVAENEAVITEIIELSPWPSEVEGWTTAAMWQSLPDVGDEQARARAIMDLWNSGELVRIRLVDGRVGENVTGVVLTTQGGSEITAIVNDGRFVAWYPHDVTEENVLNRLIATITVTLNDGTQIATNVEQPSDSPGVR